jgi:GTPase SAR1 family protein
MNDKNIYIEYLNTSKDIIAPLYESKLNSAMVAVKEIDEMIIRILEKPEPLMVFVGSYSSGKSTIIKRLTGAELATGINPLTSEISNDILWKDLRVVDTPGLKSNQVEHDAKTLAFIGKADIVVWVIEADRLLLDEHKIAFSKVAIDLLKADRIFIVINQMDLTGVDIQDENEWKNIKEIKINEINKILREKNISITFPISCIAADPDQIADGLTVNEAIEEWKKSPYAEKSHFEEFKELFDAFIKSDGIKMSFKGSVDRAYEYMGYVKDDLFKIKITFEKTNELANIKLNGLHEINKKASLRFGTMKSNNRYKLNKLFNDEFKKFINNITKPEEYCQLLALLDENKINSIIDKFVNESFESFISNYDTYIDELYIQEENRLNGLYLKKEIEGCLEEISNLFRERPSVDYGTFKKVDFSFKKENFFVENKDEISKLIKHGLGSLPKDKEVYRGIVYNIGKKMGKKFKPYEAVKLGEKVSKVVKALPVVLAAFEIVMDFVKFFRAGNEIEKLENKKAELLQSINTIEQEVWSIIDAELSGYYDSISLPLNDEIKDELTRFDNNKIQIKLYNDLSKNIVDHQNMRMYI